MKMMEINEIYAIIIAAAPAITAIIGIIVSLMVGIKRIKQANTATLGEVRSKNAYLEQKVDQIAQKNEELIRENNELKKDLRRVMAKLNRVHLVFKDKVSYKQNEPESETEPEE